MLARDTIVAISSTVGAAGRVIVRISGDRAANILHQLAPAVAMTGGAATLAQVWPGVTAWVYRFTAPRSYTGEDSVELHLPGSAVLARMILDQIVRLGARQAEPGEFTARAYFNGRMDLTQAEGVAAMIGAQGERELRAARQLLGGELARRLAPVMDAVAATLALVEVGIDFTDEDVTFIAADEVRQHCGEAEAALAAIVADSARYERVAHEPRVVLVGRPNAGKSTLLNRLAGHDRAVVSAVAGTTRDAIWATVQLRRGIVRVIDVAGIEDVAGDAPGVGGVEASIAAQMRGQARQATTQADVVVMVSDATDPRPLIDMGRPADLLVRSKIDQPSSIPAGAGLVALDVSALTGEGIDALRDRLGTLAFGEPSSEAGLALNARHLRGIDDAREALRRAALAASAGPELAAMELREAIEALGGILGKVSPDELLGRVFSRFCIGK